jgi:YesN/AraC family two-component response regulator
LADSAKLSISPELGVLRAFNLQLLRKLDKRSPESKFTNIGDALEDLKVARECKDADILNDAVDNIIKALGRGPDEASIRSEFRMNAEQIRKTAETEVKHLHRSLQVIYQEEISKIRNDIVTSIRKHVTDNLTLVALADDFSAIFSR